MEHIAICRQPLFDLILNGTKTIESRWSMNKIAPYNKVRKGDTLLLKETGKDVIAKTQVLDVKYYELSPEIVEEIRIKYGEKIRTDKFENWEKFLQKKYCTLIWLGGIEKISPLKVPKSNGAGWIVLKNDENKPTLEQIKFDF